MSVWSVGVMDYWIIGLMQHCNPQQSNTPLSWKFPTKRFLRIGDNAGKQNLAVYLTGC
jgi:hypothetical protein